jgi:hypothetical protein
MPWVHVELQKNQPGVLLHAGPPTLASHTHSGTDFHEECRQRSDHHVQERPETSAGDIFLTWRNVAHSKDPVSATQYSFRQLVKICFGKIVKLKSFVARAVNRGQKTCDTGMPKRQFVPHRHTVAMHKRRKNSGRKRQERERNGNFCAVY